MEPINYMVDMPDPSRAIFEGYAQGLGQQTERINQQIGRQGIELAAAQEARDAEMQPLLMEQRQLGNQSMQQEIQQGAELHPLRVQQMQLDSQMTQAQIAGAEAEAQRVESFRNDFGVLASLGSDATVADFRSVAMAYPEFGEMVMGTFDSMNEAQQRDMVSYMGQAVVALQSGQTEFALELIDEYAGAAAASGNDELARSAEATRMLAEADPRAALASLALSIETIAPDVNERLFQRGEDAARVQKVVEVGPSLAVHHMSDGSTQVIDTTTNEVLQGAAAQEAIQRARADEVEQQQRINDARTRGSLEARVDLASDAAYQGEEGKRRLQIAADGLKASGPINRAISSIEAAIKALDEGAQSGPVYESLPNITKESATLQNSINEMALAVIGSATFGALSGTELQFALDTAAPLGLPPAELRAWLVEKLEAQRKVRAAILEEAEFLSKPGNTLNDWIKVVQGRNRAADAAAGQPTGQPVAQPTGQPTATPPAGPAPSIFIFDPASGAFGPEGPSQ